MDVGLFAKVIHKGVYKRGHAVLECINGDIAHLVPQVTQVIRRVFVRLGASGCTQGTEENRSTSTLFCVPQERKGRAQAQLSRICRVYPMDERAAKHPRKLCTESSGDKVVDGLVVDAQGSVSSLQRLLEKSREERATQVCVRRPEGGGDVEGRRRDAVDPVRAR